MLQFSNYIYNLIALLFYPLFLYFSIYTRIFKMKFFHYPVFRTMSTEKLFALNYFIGKYLMIQRG